MTITPIAPINMSVRQELVYDIMMVLDDAIVSDEPVSVHELANTIVTMVEDTQSKPRFRIQATSRRD